MNTEVHQNVTLVASCIVTLVLLWGAACRAGTSDQALAESLANDNTREAAIVSIAASTRDKVPLLLSWTRRPPGHVAECGLDTGLADAFGQLKTKEAIPFLIKNISLYRSCVSLAPWLKVPAVIEWNLPAVGALVKIGPDASTAVIAAFRSMTEEEDRRSAIFVVSHIKGVPEAQHFLKSVSARANREEYWAEEGIKLLEAGSNGVRR